MHQVLGMALFSYQGNQPLCMQSITGKLMFSLKAVCCAYGAPGVCLSYPNKK